jgi:ribosomal protein S17E
MTTMSIKTFLNVSAKLPGETSVLLRGPHGIGKSQVVRQVAKGFGLTVTDRRLSQMTEGDMVGLPSTDGEVTRFNPPDWYKAACDKPVCLFLDELNRATPEVMQAAFQIVLDRELNGWKLHPQTRVFAAINASAAYTVNEMDPALLDRFWTIDLTPTVADWVAWAREGAVHDSVVEFIAGNEKWLDAPKDAEPGKVTPSRRSWERLSTALSSAGVVEAPDDHLFYPMCLGFIGTEATIAFHSFVKTIDNQVSGEEVLKDYSKVKKKVKKLGQEKQNILIEKVAEYVTKQLKTIDEKQGPNLRDFMNDLPGELRVSAWSKLTAGGVENLELAKAVHKYCVEAILEVFGVNADDAAKALAAPAGAKGKTKK